MAERLFSPDIPTQMGTAPGTSTGAFGSIMSVPAGAYSVGGPAMPGLPITSGVPGRGHRQSEKLVQTSFATVPWLETGFEKKQAIGQFLFCVRAHGQKREQLSMATPFQLNSLLRGIHDRVKQVGLRARAGNPAIEPDDYAQIDELLYQLREHNPDLARTISPNHRISDEARKGVMQYLFVDGIKSLWNLVGVYVSDGGREMRNFYSLNIGVQGPCLVDDVFQPLAETPGLPEPELGPRLEQGDSCRFILKRRFSHVTQQFEEFVVEPHASATRYAPSEATEFTDPDTGRIEFGPTYHVGHVLDVLPQKPDARLLVRMRGIATSWEDAYNAHGANVARVKLALGPDTYNYAT